MSVFNWLNARFPLLSIWKKYFSEYYVAKNLNFYYCFGALALFVLANQLLTGFWLALFYTPTIDQAFQSIERIMRDVNYGWLLRYMHTTGASAFFVVIYLHIFRSLLYGSYQKPRELVWLLGVALFFILLLEGVLGYLLPWGQLSYWGAQVMTSLLSAIPIVGETLVTWIRGDFMLGQVTLQRFYALHIIAMPVCMLLFSFLHVVALHQVGSSNPDGIDIHKKLNKQGQPIDGVPFYPCYMLKDFFAMLIFLVIFFAIVFFFPTFGGYFLEPANAEPANPLFTPHLITPLWYLSPFYGILRAVPDKGLGVFILCWAMGILFFMPWLDRSPVRSMRYKGPMSRMAFLLMLLSFIALGILGQQELNPFNQHLAQGATILYFAYFLGMPFYTRFEKTRPLPERITR